jgi:hypothetical protein
MDVGNKIKAKTVNRFITENDKYMCTNNNFSML